MWQVHAMEYFTAPTRNKLLIRVMSEPQKHDAKRKKSHTSRHTLYVHETVRKGKFTDRS